MAHKARDTGADLREGFEVSSVPLFDAQSGLWTVTSSEARIPSLSQTTFSPKAKPKPKFAHLEPCSGLSVVLECMLCQLQVAWTPPQGSG